MALKPSIRRFLFALLALFAAAGLYTVYSLLQAPVKLVTQELPAAEDPTKLKPNESARSIGPGQGVWVSQFDSSGRLTTQFRASEFTPKADGSVLASFPEARVMLQSGDIIHLVADTGTIVLPDAPSSKKNSALGGDVPQMPSRGKLQNVTVHVEDANGQPRLSLKMNNAAFDNDTFRIYTDSYVDPTGKTIAADRVKVEIRGEDVDFDGYGLTLRWDDKTQIIQLLEIAHGERVVLKKTPEGFQAAHDATPERIVTAATFGVSPLLSDGIPIQLASTDSTIPEPATTKPKRQQPYRTKLHDNVRIVQAGQTLGTGDLLTIDFLTESNATDSPKGKNKQSTTAPTAVEPPTAAPAPTTAPTVAATAPAATKPAVDAKPAKANEPVTVYWTGPLRMVPLIEPPLGQLATNQAVAELSGKAVTLQQAGATVHAGSALYRTIDGGVVLRPAAGATTVTMTDADGRTLTSGPIEFDGAQHVARLTSAGKLDVPASAETGDKALAASWSQGATLTLVGEGKSQTLQDIACEGNVSVQHPQLSLTSGKLGLHFSPGADARKPVLRQVTASQAVKAVTTDDSGTKTIESDSIALDATSDDKGNVVPEKFTATGNVHAYDDTQHLRTDLLVATLGAGDKPDAAPVLKELTATGNVRLAGKDDTSATADKLHVTTDEAGRAQTVELTAAKGATVASPQGRITGPMISVDPETGVAIVNGAGSLNATQGQGKDVRPITVTWTKSAVVDAPKNVVDITGDVRTTSKSPDATTVESSRSHAVRITLAEKPADPKRETDTGRAKPATKPASKLGGFGGDSDVFGNKEPVAVALTGKVSVDSVETIDGKQTRQSHLDTEELQYDLKTERATIPGPGRILYEDTRPLAKGDDPETRGSTAIGWQKTLWVDRSTNKAHLEGDVIIKHQPSTPEGKPITVQATAIDADLVPEADKKTAGAATKPSTDIGVKRVIATGPVSFESEGQTFVGSTLEYDAATQVITASGTETQPMNVLDANGQIAGVADRVRFSLATNRVESIDNFRVTVRK